MVTCLVYECQISKHINAINFRGSCTRASGVVLGKAVNFSVNGPKSLWLQSLQAMCWGNLLTKYRLHTFYLKFNLKSNDQTDTYQCTLECSFTCNLSMFLAQPTTVIPCSTRAVAIAPPMPSEAPVTTATRPDQRSIFIQFLLLWTPCVTRLSSTRLGNYCSISADTL